MTPKEQATESARKLREQAKLMDPMARTTVELVGSLIDLTKERLVDATGDDMLRLQGAAREYRRLLGELTIQPPSIPTKE